NDQHFTEKLAVERPPMVLWVATLRDRVGGRDGGGLASRRRERKAQTGLMLLGDVSRHDWLAGPGWRWWGALDDATSRRRGGRPHYAIGMPPDARLEPDLDRDTARDGRHSAPSACVCSSSARASSARCDAGGSSRHLRPGARPLCARSAAVTPDDAG